MESEKKLSPPKKLNLDYNPEKKVHKNQSTHSSNDIMMQSKSMITKYSK
jgi:hypothetical protein